MRRIIPCRDCGGTACELELPVLDGVAAQLFRPILKLAAARQGLTLSGADVENPLEQLDGAAIGELLAIECSDCVELRELELRLQARA